MMNYMKSNIYLKLAYLHIARVYNASIPIFFGINSNTLFLELMVIPYFFSNTLSFGVNGK